MRVVVIGATGSLGKPVTLAMLQAGFTVRIVARNVAGAKKQFPGAEIVAGDLQNPDSLTTAFQGMDAVYLNLSVLQTEKQTDFHAEGEGVTNVLKAAKAAGIGRVGYLSSLVMRYQGMNGFNWWAFDVKQQAVQQIKASGIPYSIFYPSSFMESMLHNQRQGNNVLIIGKSDIKPWYVAASDYGKQVVKAFQIAKADQNQEYVIQGPEAITQLEAADRFVAAYKKESLKVQTLPSLVLKLSGFFSAPANYGWHITEAINKYPETFEAAKTWEELGKPTTTVEQFAQQA